MFYGIYDNIQPYDILISESLLISDQYPTDSRPMPDVQFFVKKDGNQNGGLKTI